MKSLLSQDFWIAGIVLYCIITVYYKYNYKMYDAVPNSSSTPVAPLSVVPPPTPTSLGDLDEDDNGTSHVHAQY